ncbi:MAG: phosphatase PAP2 family protein [Deltaproteobacteria bacterium]|nr:phosphatase PAP2 family protein [Deltaproteobacteria bacterium]
MRNSTPNRLKTYGLLLLLGLVLLVAVYDVQLSQALRHDDGAGAFLALIGSWFGHGAVQMPLLALLCAAGYVFSRPRLVTAAFLAFSAFVSSGILAQLFKHLIGRPRPRLLDQGIDHFGPTLASGLDSFPSGHASTAVAVAVVLSFWYPKATPIFMTAAAFISASRVLGGSHFFIDILGGVCLGLIVGLSIGLNKRWRSKMDVRDTFAL